MWYSRKFWFVGLLCVVMVILTSLVAMRHRHTGDQFHSHSHEHPHKHHHPHGHDHSHSHSHSHAAESKAAATNNQHQGWHIHLFVLGWEITFWEHGVEVLQVAQPQQESVPRGTSAETVFQGPEILQSGTDSWTTFTFVIPVLLLPLRRVVCSPCHLSVNIEEFLFLRGRLRECPPTPPPR